jgi:DNA-directed RNA polymerase specialized sigma24 family protein
MELHTDEDQHYDSSLTILYNQHAPTIFAYLRFHTSSREDAEDLLLEVFLAALEFEQILERSEEKQRAWLRSVAHHKMVDSALQQQVVQLHFVYGLRCAEIALVLGKNEGAVRKLLTRALQCLRALHTQE